VYPLAWEDNVNRRTLRHTLAVSLVVLLALMATACGSGSKSSPTAIASPVSGSPVVTAGSPAAAAPTSTPIPGSQSTVPFVAAVRDVVQQAKPAVVQITSQQVSVDQFNQPFTVPSGVGSGVIYDKEGHILTNNHVVEGAQQLLVSLPDGRSFTGKLVGTDAQTDLAVVQVTGDNLPVATLGDSKALQVGDWVVAIGNALALEGGPTVTTGVVSALGRSVQEPADSTGTSGPFLFDVIQTDAAINPGNSGGPLINLQGQVVGLNTLVAGQAELGLQAEGIGFAISIARAKPIADQLVASGHVDHAFLGVRYVPLTPAIAAQAGVKQTEGALVMAVSSNSPAASAGLRAEDVITQIDGTKLQGESDLARAIDAHKPGDKIELTVARGNQELKLQVTLGSTPSS
jgi:S1-C subfamily serine protease